MSLRTLIEINHDYTHRIDDHAEAFVAELERYLCSSSREAAEALERYGIRVIGTRHHSGNFIIDGTPDGFPVQHLVKAKA